MPKRIDVQINRDGTMKAEFSGFAGDDCIDQAERLREVLAGFGLLVEPAAVERKDPAQIAAETGVEEEVRTGEARPVKGTS
ncbi:MAG: hypothetical protein Q8P31_00335 [Bacillota bacterium]|nr:hypothetical protein [Bacillota bacterium]